MRRSLLATCAALAISITILADHIEVARFQAGREFVQVTAGVQLIAHAGGATSDGHYSNSLEAIEKAHAAGIRWFEVDLSLTSDGELVLMHDWAQSWRYWFGGSIAYRAFARLTPNSPPSLEAFKGANVRGNRTALSFRSLCNWSMERPDTKFFLDPKDDPKAILKAVVDACPQGLGQLVWYTSSRNIAAFAREQGFDQVALSYYYGRLPLREVERKARTGEFDYVDLSVTNFGRDEFEQVVSWGLPVIAWTINSPELAQELGEAGVTAIMTDTLRP